MREVREVREGGSEEGREREGSRQQHLFDRLTDHELHFVLLFLLHLRIPVLLGRDLVPVLAGSSKHKTKTREVREARKAREAGRQAGRKPDKGMTSSSMDCTSSSGSRFSSSISSNSRFWFSWTGSREGSK